MKRKMKGCVRGMGERGGMGEGEIARGEEKECVYEEVNR